LRHGTARALDIVARVRQQFGHGSAVLRDGEAFALLDSLQQFRQVGLGVVRAD
jgi:hypothetical protein